MKKAPEVYRYPFPIIGKESELSFLKKISISEEVPAYVKDGLFSSTLLLDGTEFMKKVNMMGKMSNLLPPVSECIFCWSRPNSHDTILNCAYYCQLLPLESKYSRDEIRGMVGEKTGWLFLLDGVFEIEVPEISITRVCHGVTSRDFLSKTGKIIGPTSYKEIEPLTGMVQDLHRKVLQAFSTLRETNGLEETIDMYVNLPQEVKEFRVVTD